MDETSLSHLKVALLLPLLTGGGAERVTLNLIEGLEELNCEVHLVLFAETGELVGSVPRGVKLIDLKCDRAVRAPWPLARYLKREKPDVMIGTQGHANLVALLAKRMAGVSTRLVLTEHLAVATQPEGMKDRLYRLLAKSSYKNAEAVVAVSGGVADTLAAGVKIPREAVTVIYNPVLTRQYWASAAERVDHPWFGSGEPPVILGVGRLVPQKDFPTLIKAFKLVLEKRPARLVILGEGPDRAALEGLVSELGLRDQVLLPGFLSNPASYMANSGVFALSSVREGLPTVLIEALATGVPVVSTDCESGPREILDGGRYGRLVPVGDHAALAAAIVTALDQPRGSVDDGVLAQYTPREAARSYLGAAGYGA